MHPPQQMKLNHQLLQLPQFIMSSHYIKTNLSFCRRRRCRRHLATTTPPPPFKSPTTNTTLILPFQHTPQTALTSIQQWIQSQNSFITTIPPNLFLTQHIQKLYLPFYIFTIQTTTSATAQVGQDMYIQ